MSPELQNKLYEKYPKIFKQRHLNMTETLMCWGFDCDDGWYALLDVLCEAIQAHVDYSTRVRDNEIAKGLATEPYRQVEAVQVKEKFGALRFYTNNSDEYVTGLIDMAERMSARTSEQCGAPGTLVRKRWYKTLCDKHEQDLTVKTQPKESIEP